MPAEFGVMYIGFNIGFNFNACCPMTYSHIVGRSVDIRRRVGRHSFITGVVSTILNGAMFNFVNLRLTYVNLVFNFATVD